MTLSTATLAPTAADTLAARHWTANLRALSITQPALVDRVQSLPVVGEWVFARDNSLTLRTLTGQWMGECSVPYLAGVAMLRSLDPRGSVACFLAPNHAAEIRASLERLSAQQAVIVLLPDLTALRTMLACEDFSAAIESHRLFFAAGAEWTAELQSIFEHHPGLPTPQQFIKLPTIAAELADALIAESQKVFCSVLTVRAERISLLRDAPRRAGATAPRIGLIAGSIFKLWDDAGAALAEALRPATLGEGSSAFPANAHATTGAPAAKDAASRSAVVDRLDPDLPLFAGPVAVAEFFASRDAIVMADVARENFPNVLPMDLPWVTWVTRGRLPSYIAAGPGDALLVTQPAVRQAAIAAGWPAERVAIAARPALATNAAPSFTGWTIIADTQPITEPKKLDEFSSHRVLWEQIAAELNATPLVASEDPAGYLAKRCKSADIDPATLDRRTFIDSLIVPAYQQSIVREMIKQRVPLRVSGRGWGEIAEFKSIAAGPITDRTQLAAAVATSARLVHVWPGEAAHPIETVGRPILRPFGQRMDVFVQQLKQSAAAPAPASTGTAISIDAICSVLPANFRESAKEQRLY